MQGSQGFRQLGHGESGLGAGGEMRQPEVHRVGAGFDGRVELRPVTGGTLDFGFENGRNHYIKCMLLGVLATALR
jgi:hypothetical protein